MSYTYQVKKEISPIHILFEDFYTRINAVYRINWVHKNYIIKKYDVIVNNRIDNKLEDIVVYDVAHPNAYIPEEKLVKKKLKHLYKKMNFCISDEFKGIEVNDKTSKHIEYILKVWNLNSAHYWPDLRKKYIRYKGKRLPVNNPFERR